MSRHRNQPGLRGALRVAARARPTGLGGAELRRLCQRPPALHTLGCPSAQGCPAPTKSADQGNVRPLPDELLPGPRLPAGDLDRLPGVGPGLIWALDRAGLRCLADLAPLAPSELAARLGPLGRLVPAERWIAAAREAEG